MNFSLASHASAHCGAAASPPGSCTRHAAILLSLFTRLTNAFSKKLENHAATVALYFVYYNFARVHQPLCVTPAMEAGIAEHVWSIEEIVGLLER